MYQLLHFLHCSSFLPHFLSSLFVPVCYKILRISVLSFHNTGWRNCISCYFITQIRNTLLPNIRSCNTQAVHSNNKISYFLSGSLVNICQEVLITISCCNTHRCIHMACMWLQQIIPSMFMHSKESIYLFCSILFKVEKTHETISQCLSREWQRKLFLSFKTRKIRWLPTTNEWY